MQIKTLKFSLLGSGWSTILHGLGQQPGWLNQERNLWGRGHRGILFSYLHHLSITMIQSFWNYAKAFLDWRHLPICGNTFCILFQFQFPRSLRTIWSWRTLAYQEVILRIGPLALLIGAINTQKNSVVDLKQPSLPSGPFLIFTS